MESALEYIHLYRFLKCCVNFHQKIDLFLNIIPLYKEFLSIPSLASTFIDYFLQRGVAYLSKQSDE